MEHFTPLSALLGGVLIGLSTASVLALQGKLAGISGICGGILQGQRGDLGWRAGFVLGLLSVGALGARIAPAAVDVAGTPPIALVSIAGLLVGFGTRLGNGCTSGHGVCGLSRFSLRSLVATLLFIASGAATVFVWRHVLGNV